MKRTTYNILQRQGLRLFLCAVVLTTSTVAMAQDDLDDEDAPAIKAPKRKTIADNNPTITIQGNVVDDATKAPLAGVRVQALGNPRYVAMTDEQGQFSVKVPTFATALYVQAPEYLSQQVAISAGDEQQHLFISLLSDAFASMYDDGTTITAKAGFESRGGGLTIDEEMTRRLGGDIRMNMHSGNLEQGTAMFIRGISSINANAQPLIILEIGRAHV